MLFSYIYPDQKYRFFSRRTLIIIGPSIILLIIAAVSQELVKGVLNFQGVKKFQYGYLRYYWEFQFNLSLLYAFYRFFRFYQTAQGMLRRHLLYITIANLSINITAGFTNVFLLWFGVFDYIWLGPPLTLIWFSIVLYTIVRYRLMDVTVVFTRLGIFLFVYTLVLGVYLVNNS